MSEYDSTEDTLKHIATVRQFMRFVASEIELRGIAHDKSKLEAPEKEMYDKYTPLLNAVSYGSDEYKKYLSEMGTALKHHYENNSHHPEHYLNGISGMSLFDLVEMFCDWKAASLRVKDGNFKESIIKNQKRFGYNDMLRDIFMNTANELDW